MAVKEVPTQFETSDGREFSTKEEAERHDKLITAKREYEAARRAFGRCLAETQRTADGKLFDFGVLRDYYYIVPGWAGMPNLTCVYFSGWNFDVEENGDDPVIYHDVDGKRRGYRFSDLYYHEAAARTALLEAQEKWLAERAEEIEELRAKTLPRR